MSVAGAVLRPTRAIAEALERRPGWWVVPAGIAAWVAMGRHGRLGGSACPEGSFADRWASFALMVVAMMLPLRLDSIRWTVERTFDWRRRRAAVEYVVGYLAPWLAAGAAASWWLETSAGGRRWAPVLAFDVAAAWALFPARERWMGASRRTFALADDGLHADVDCLRLGAAQGLACVVSCGPLMLGCAATGHSAVAMVGGALIGAYEQATFRPRPFGTVLGCGLLAIWSTGVLSGI